MDALVEELLRDLAQVEGAGAVVHAVGEQEGQLAGARALEQRVDVLQPLAQGRFAEHVAAGHLAAEHGGVVVRHGVHVAGQGAAEAPHGDQAQVLVRQVVGEALQQLVAEVDAPLPAGDGGDGVHAAAHVVQEHELVVLVQPRVQLVVVAVEQGGGTVFRRAQRIQLLQGAGAVRPLGKPALLRAQVAVEGHGSEAGHAGAVGGDHGVQRGQVQGAVQHADGGADVVRAHGLHRLAVHVVGSLVQQLEHAQVVADQRLALGMRDPAEHVARDAAEQALVGVAVVAQQVLGMGQGQVVGHDLGIEQLVVLQHAAQHIAQQTQVALVRHAQVLLQDAGVVGLQQEGMAQVAAALLVGPGPGDPVAVVLEPGVHTVGVGLVEAHGHAVDLRAVALARSAATQEQGRQQQQGGQGLAHGG